MKAKFEAGSEHSVVLKDLKQQFHLVRIVSIVVTSSYLFGFIKVAMNVFFLGFAED